MHYWDLRRLLCDVECADLWHVAVLGVRLVRRLLGDVFGIDV